MSAFGGSSEPPETPTLGHEATPAALLSLIGCQVLVLLSGLAGEPFIVGRLDRGELDERLQALFLRADEALVETLFLHVDSRQSGFVLRPDEFVQAVWRMERQLTIHLGDRAVSVLEAGELGDALRSGASAWSSASVRGGLRAGRA
jgi:hypothetical protein